MIKTFRIFHTNDIHSHFSHWSQIAAYFNDARKQCEINEEPSLLFDIGDHLDRSHPMTEGTNGKGNVELLNALAYDAITIGNNEGVTLSKKQLEVLYEDADFPVLVANLRDETGNNNSSMQACQSFYLENGLTIAAIGLTIPFANFYQPLGWEVIDPLEVLDELIGKVRQNADIVILLSHLGYYNDQKIAEAFEGIDLILGAHTHHLLEKGEEINGTTILQAGKFGDFVGETKISFDTASGKMSECIAKSINIETYRSDHKTEKLLIGLLEKGKLQLQEPVAILHNPLEADWFVASSFSEILAEALKEWCEADVGMVNAGVLLDSLPAGEVRREDLHRVCPHPINPCKLKLSGRELKDIVQRSLTNEIRHKKVKGLGFRGKVLGAFVFDGIRIEAVNKVILSVKVKDKPLEEQDEYEVATLDMFTFGMIFPELAKKEKQYYLPEMLRDVLAWKLAKMGTSSSIRS